MTGTHPHEPMKWTEDITLLNKLAEYKAEKPISTDNIKDANILKATPAP